MSSQFMPPSLVSDIQSLDRRLKSLEMSARSSEAVVAGSADPQTVITSYMGPPAEAPPAVATYGHSAAWTSLSGQQSLWFGDFRSTGRFILGGWYLWVESASEDVEVSLWVREIGGGVATQIASATHSGGSGLFSGPSFNATLPTAALVDPTEIEVRNRYWRYDINAERTSGTGKVGVSIWQAIVNY